MNWSWKIGKLGGIDLRVHITFVLLLGWVWVKSWMVGHSAEGILAMASFVFALFAAVVLHELGHQMAARKFGIEVRNITLLPIGGITPLERTPKHLEHEIFVALAGPAANALLALLLCAWLIVMHSWEPIDHVRVATGPFIERLFLANVWLVIFNLIPVSPMDGGRVLRAFLARKMNYAKSTQLVASSGQALALVLGFLGLFTGPMLLFIGLFIWIGANEELYAVQMRTALSGTSAAAMMVTEFERLQVGDTLADAVRLTLKGADQDFPVVDGYMVVGILTRTQLLTALAERGHEFPVSQAMRKDFATADTAEMVDGVFRRMQNCDCHTAPVSQDGQLMGLITMEQVGEYLLSNANPQERKHGSASFKQMPARALEI